MTSRHITSNLVLKLSSTWSQCGGDFQLQDESEAEIETDWMKEHRDHYTLQRAKVAPCNGCRRHSLPSCTLMLCDIYLFTLPIILGAEIMHFTVCSLRTPGMHQHLHPLNTFSFLNHHILSLALPRSLLSRLFLWN